MKLMIDNRENNKRIESARNYFQENGYDVSVSQLVVGDYVFDNRVAIEFKTPADMISSIIDGRVFRQSEKMKQYPFSYVLIVGDVVEEINARNERNYWNKKNQIRSFGVKNYLGGLARLQADTKVIHVSNNKQAWVLLDYLVKKLLDTNPNIRGVDRPRATLSDAVATFLSCIYVNDSQRVGIKTAVMIREYLHLENLSDLLEVTYEDLVSVKGVGAKTAKKIMEVLE